MILLKKKNKRFVRACFVDMAQHVCVYHRKTCARNYCEIKHSLPCQRSLKYNFNYKGVFNDHVIFNLL